MTEINRILYFDYNSTTPVEKRVVEKIMPYFNERFANASSGHSWAESIKKDVSDCRERIAGRINANSNEIFFTSGSTEAINIAIKGVAEKFKGKGKHIITASTEHKAVISTCKYLESIGHEITYLPVDDKGLVDLNSLNNSIRQDTVLVSIMHVNNETGVIQPVKEISKITHKAGAYYMSDCTQSIGKLNVDVREQGIDILCFSGHKIYSTKGTGVLYINNEIGSIPSIIHGGGQENGVRSGTLNVPGIIAIDEALCICMERIDVDSNRIKDLRDYIEEKLTRIPGVTVNGSIENRIYNVSNLCFSGIEVNVLIKKYKDFAVSNGSACSSAIVQPSHVLKAMGLNDEDAFSSVRISLGRNNTIDEAKRLVEVLYEICNMRG